MPLIDQQMIKSLEHPDGTYSQFTLYLLGAIPQGHRDEPLKVPAPDWQEHALCRKISGVLLRTIRNEADRIKRMKDNTLSRTRRSAKSADPQPPELRQRPSAAPEPRSPQARLRALKRKLNTRHKHTMALINRELDNLTV